MNLDLPPQRTLGDKERMVDRILVRPVTKPSHPRRVVWISGLVAAAVGVTATALGIATLQQGGHVEVGAPPSVTASPQQSDVPPPTTTPSGDLTLGQAANFTNFAVTVHSTRQAEGVGFFVDAEVCVRKLPADPTGDTTRISWDPWTVTTTKGVVRPDSKMSLDALRPLYAREAFHRVGECERGWIPFGGPTTHAKAILSVNYHNELDNRAAWLAWSISGPKIAYVGETVTKASASGRTLKITVSDPIRSGGVYAIHVKTCVVSLPADEQPGGLSLTESSWTLLTTSQTVVTTDAPITDAPPLPTTYPPSGNYRVGECAVGYIPFGVDPEVGIESIRFNDSTTWVPTH